MPARIAIIGAGGQLGRELTRVLGERGVPLSHADIEITNPVRVSAALGCLQPDAVVNAAAFNLVDAAECDLEATLRVNALGPLHLARECASRSIPLVHVSTDYVFGLDGARRQPYTEDDLPGPVNAYGVSKLAGEQLVRMTAPRHFIVRTCGLYGVPAPGSKGNFVQTILRLAKERDELRIVDDQSCTPTSAADLAEAIGRLVETSAWGTYHATNAGECSWFEFAREIIRLSGLTTRVVPVSSAEFARPARRPEYSVLSGGKLAGVLGSPLRPWPVALAEYLRSATAG